MKLFIGLTTTILALSLFGSIGWLILLPLAVVMFFLVGSLSDRSSSYSATTGPSANIKSSTDYGTSFFNSDDLNMTNSLNDISSNNMVGTHNDYQDSMQINPANGLPMIGGIGGVDVEGNPYGTDRHSDDLSSHCSSLDLLNDFSCSSSSSNAFDSFGTTDSFSDSFNDSFSSGGINDDW
ncbi:hypothetical protein QWY77_08240 [Thalassotalea ponticola]|uniref:hypothetical protein n=1 Tax=Thalassotalea ponticola TaxID=1523392 RepID=UPI0025B4C383|nr:hypothetical protein [Thalassotalea ponticola]MDN3652753.1 hypothetical protein [Thalassotalea ponticola]